jgi:hypothetical protein
MGHKEYENGTLCPGKNFNLDVLRNATNLKYNPRGVKIIKSYPSEQYTNNPESDN